MGVVGDHKTPAIFDHDGGAITAKSWGKTNKDQTYTFPELSRFTAVQTLVIQLVKQREYLRSITPPGG